MSEKNSACKFLGCAPGNLPGGRQSTVDSGKWKVTSAEKTVWTRLCRPARDRDGKDTHAEN